MAENIEILIKYNYTPLDNIFDTLSSSNNFNKLNFLNEIHSLLEDGYSYNDACEISIKNFYVRKFVDKEDILLIESFLSTLGKSDVYGQIQNCKTYKEFFKNKLNLLEQNESGKCKTTAIFPLCIGMMMSIILI